MKKDAIGRGNNTRHGACTENNDWFGQIGGCLKDKTEDKLEQRDGNCESWELK